MFCVFTIKDIRERKGISLRKLGQVTNISRTYIGQLEANKKTNPSITVLAQIADALEVDIKDLFYTSQDIDYLKKKLDKTIEKYGLHSKRVAQISKIIDTLVTHELKEKKNSNNIVDENSTQIN